MSTPHRRAYTRMLEILRSLSFDGEPVRRVYRGMAPLSIQTPSWIVQGFELSRPDIWQNGFADIQEAWNCVLIYAPAEAQTPDRWEAAMGFVDVARRAFAADLTLGGNATVSFGGNRAGGIVEIHGRNYVAVELILGLHYFVAPMPFGVGPAVTAGP